MPKFFIYFLLPRSTTELSISKARHTQQMIVQVHLISVRCNKPPHTRAFLTIHRIISLIYIMPKGFLNSTPNWWTKNHFLLHAGTGTQRIQSLLFCSVKIGRGPKQTLRKNWKFRGCQDFRMAPFKSESTLDIICSAYDRWCGNNGLRPPAHLYPSSPPHVKVITAARKRWMDCSRSFTNDTKCQRS